MKTKILFAALLLLLCVTTLLASDTQVDGIWYNFDSNSQTATVTYRGQYSYSYSNEYTGSVVIPSSITYNGTTYSVTSIGNEAFSNCSGLTSVTIPNSVTSIERYAFSNCSGLTSVTIPNSVTSIGNRAFLGCTGLTSVTIPNSVTSIGDYAFSDCSSLTSVTIGNSVTSIGSYAFYNCSGLTSVTIPNSVTSIGNHAFYGCSGLTSPVYNAYVFAFMPTSYSGAYIIPDGIESIAGGAFYNCSGLTSVTIPNSVTSIGSGVFRGCSLTEVHISDIAAWCNFSFGSQEANPLYYAHHLYLNDTEITDLVIPNSVTSIGKYTFYGYSGLTVTIGNNVTTIGDYAFQNCSNLETISLGTAMQTIGEQAFSGCKKIIDIYCYAEHVPNVVSSTFNDVNRNAYLWVPANLLRYYRTREIWCEFLVQAISADGVNATTVNVVPDYNTAKVVWPEVTGADTYEIVIRDQQGNVICSLVFNSDGQLQSIAFGAPVRDRDNAPEQAQSTGFRFEVTGLDEGTTYNYTITAKDAGETVLDTQSGSFTTKGGTGVEEVEGQRSLVESPRKVIENGRVVIILPDGRRYSAQGSLMME